MAERNQNQGPWATRDVSLLGMSIMGFADLTKIVYLSLVGPILLAALLEWFLWLAAFCYCLGKAFKKADHWSQQVLAVVMILFFVTFRYAN